MLGGLSVPLSWGTAVPEDDFNHWAKESEEGAEAELVPGAVTPEGVETAEELDEWSLWNEWVAENEEPRFDLPRTINGVVPKSPAAG
jgi:hypothetical protein